MNDAGADSFARARSYLFATMAGIALYVVLDAIAQSLPPHYSAISQAESDLAVGPYGYVMAVNFVNRGVFSLLFVYGVWKAAAGKKGFTTGLALFGFWGVGALILSVAPTDVTGPATIHGVVHLVVATLAFLTASVGALSLSRSFSRESLLDGAAGYAETIAILAVVAFLVLLFGPAVLPRASAKFGGLTERVFLGLVLLWMLTISASVLRSAGLQRSPKRAGGQTA